MSAVESDRDDERERSSFWKPAFSMRSRDWIATLVALGVLVPLELRLFWRGGEDILLFGLGLTYFLLNPVLLIILLCNWRSTVPGRMSFNRFALKWLLATGVLLLMIPPGLNLMKRSRMETRERAADLIRRIDEFKKRKGRYPEGFDELVRETRQPIPEPSYGLLDRTFEYRRVPGDGDRPESFRLKFLSPTRGGGLRTRTYIYSSLAEAWSVQ